MGHILHFGLGNFARSHLCDYTAEAQGWHVTGVSLRSAAVRDALRPNGFAYDLAVQGQGMRRINVLRDILVASEDPQAVLQAVIDPDTSIISVTVTEKGYHLDRKGVLDLDDPAIVADLTGQDCKTLIGFLAHGLAQRAAPVTVLSCDNRIENGVALCAAVKRFADAAGLVLKEALIRFPNAMVDRITPASADLRVVPTEPFREWVIEDNFAGPRPDWLEVQFVSDVTPHELRKLRMLNGAHSFLAYAGLLAGHSFVHQAIADPQLREQTQALMHAAARTLPTSVQGQTQAYSEALIERFENPRLDHALRQIAMDGTEKLPYRFIGTMRDLIAIGGVDLKHDLKPFLDGLRAWIGHCQAEEVQAGRLPDDPRADAIARALGRQNPDRQMMAIIGAEDIAIA